MSPEMIVIEDLSELHLAMYNKMATISGVPNLQFIGFGTGHQKPVLPQVGMHISIDGMDVDRTRPTPLEGSRLSIPNGVPEDITIDDVEYLGVFPERKIKYPIPLRIAYKIDAWCHDTKTSILLDQKILGTFPERGGLTFNIQDVDAFFPIYLSTVADQDDLKENIHERIYIFNLDTWIDSHLADKIVKVIKSTDTEVFKGTQISDADVPGNNLMEIILG